MTAQPDRRPRPGILEPHPDLWAALGHGVGLTQVLEDFYTRVYADPRLAPFFVHTTRQRAIEQQYSFLSAIFTGEPVYFGARPRNAHAWMVISDELFDYREDLLADCLRRYGLSEALVAHVREVDEAFRKQIVKDTPRPRKIGGVAMPLEGYEDVEMAIGALCDACGVEVPAGAMARYHVRTGETWCRACFPQDAAAPGRPAVAARIGEVDPTLLEGAQP